MCTLLEINQSIAAKFFMVNSPMFCWRISWIYFSEWTHNTNICHLICHNCLGYLNCGPSHPLDITCSSSLLFFFRRKCPKNTVSDNSWLLQYKDLCDAKSTITHMSSSELLCFCINADGNVTADLQAWNSFCALILTRKEQSNQGFHSTFISSLTMNTTGQSSWLLLKNKTSRISALPNLHCVHNA